MNPLIWYFLPNIAYTRLSNMRGGIKMIVLIGKKAWVLQQIRQACEQFSTLTQWCQHIANQQTNQPPVLFQKNKDLH